MCETFLNDMCEFEDCVGCDVLENERAAIAHAVVMLDKNAYLDHRTSMLANGGDCELCALLAEARKVVEG